MAVFRVEKNSGYTVMSNHHLRNRALSLKAKGLLSQMLSLPEDWDYTLQGLARINRESIDAIRQAIRELEQAGYIQRSRERDEKGRLRGADYVIFELPQPVPASVSPTLENPTQENPTLENPMQLNALMKIEGFRSLNSDIETIIAKSEKVKKAKKEGTKDLTPKQKKELSDEEKEYKSKRKQIQEKLIKFATRIPVFMYLTDYRERCLKDVITQLEPGLFKKVTGLSVKDFELLVSLGVFNDSLMNDAVYKFKRYEDASLSYTGIDRHEGEDRGGWDTVLSDADYNKMFTLQQASMEAPAPAPDDLPAKPYFTPDEDEPKPTPAKKPEPQPTKPIISYGGFTPKPNTAQNTLASGSKIHKPSNSYTPRPASSTPGSFAPRPVGSSVGIGAAKPSFGLNSQPAAQPKPPVKVDVSKIKVGVKVKHKAFGVGTVAGIQPDMVTVRFCNVEKKFLLPAAIVQGYLSLMEN